MVRGPGPRTVEGRPAVAGAGGEVRWNHEVPGVQRFHTDDPVGNRVEFQQVQPPKLDFTV